MTGDRPPAPQVEPFDSVAVLRKEHAALMRAARTSAPEAAGDHVEAIERFLARAGATGSRIDETDDRDAVQSMLDYWTATLLTLGDLSPARARPRLLASFDASQAPDLGGQASPYVGLRAFGDKDAEQFFGRRDAVQRLVDKVARRPVVVVAGPSGSGKSSLVLCGLVPALKAGAIAGSEAWQFFPVVVPGTDPLAALLLAVCPPSSEPRAWVAEQRPRLQKSPAILRELVERSAPARPAMLVVDQLEELFTLCPDEAIRERFAEAIMALAGAGRDHRVVLTIREGFVREALGLPALASLAGDREIRFEPPPLSPRELREMIEGPAALVGLKFDDGLVDELIKEVVGEVTALPLLQFTLLKLWERKARNRITWDTYRKVGSPREALQRTADAVFDELKTIENQRAAERIFGALVQPSVGAELLRRRVRREALARLEAPERINHVLDRFVEAGLLQMTPGTEADDDRFEVAHEALLRNWRRLDEWLRDKRQRSAREIQLVSAARLWRESGRQRGYLLSGDALLEAAKHADAAPELQELVQASMGSERWRRHRWRALAVAFGLLLLVALFFLNESRKALTEAEQARKAAEAAMENATRTASQAVNAIAKSRATESDPQPPAVTSEVIQGIITEPVARRQNFWPNGSTLKINVAGSPDLAATIARHAREWMKYANLDFDFSASEASADVRISLADQIAWSFVGTQARQIRPDQPTMSLGMIRVLDSERERRRVILHEFGHVLGLVHETQQPGARIPWNRDAAIPYFSKTYGMSQSDAERNFLRQVGPEIGYNRPFDPLSIMNYFPIPASVTNGELEVKLSYDLSESDKVLVSRIYPGRARVPGG